MLDTRGDAHQMELKVTSASLSRLYPTLEKQLRRGQGCSCVCVSDGRGDALEAFFFFQQQCKCKDNCNTGAEKRQRAARRSAGLSRRDSPWKMKSSRRCCLHKSAIT